MAPTTISPKLKTLAQDLTRDFPRSPRETLGGFVIAGRTLDKCRAHLNGTVGEYHFNCPLDQQFLSFAGIAAEDFEAFVATGAPDEDVDQWLREHAQQKDKLSIVKWNNEKRYITIKDMPDQIQLYMEDYIAENIPKGRVIYHWFDVYDIEEKRL